MCDHSFILSLARPAAFAFLAVLSASAVDATNQKFVCDKKMYVPFDSTTTVTVECPDVAAAKWLESHLTEWYGTHAPKVKAGVCGAFIPEGKEAYVAIVGDDGTQIAANTLAGIRWASYTLRQYVGADVHERLRRGLGLTGVARYLVRAIAAHDRT